MDTRDQQQTNSREYFVSLVESWKFFDRIYCISIDDRIDRREQAKVQFAAVGLLDRVEFVIVSRHPENREQGIFESHIHCLKKGLAENARNILVFEDDVFFEDFHPENLNHACAALERKSRWNGFFLGCITTGNHKTNQQNLIKIKYRCLAHAYVLNHLFAETLTLEPWTGIPFDELLRRCQSDFFALSPMCSYQGLSGTDNQTVVIDRIRRMFGGLPFIQKANQFYQNNKLLLIFFHAAVFATFGCLIFIKIEY